MNTVEIIRTVVGVFFILFGLIVYVYDQRGNMAYSEYRYSPISWLICILIGVFVVAFTIERGIYFAMAAVILWAVEKIVLIILDEKKSKIKQSM